MQNLPFARSDRLIGRLVLCLILLLIGVNAAACSAGRLGIGERTPTLDRATPTLAAQSGSEASTRLTKTREPAPPSISSIPSPGPSPTLTQTLPSLPTPRPTPPPSPTPMPTTTRPPYQMQNSTNTMGVRDFLWNPDDRRGTQRLDLSVGFGSWSPDGRQLVGWSREFQTLAILSLETGELMPLEDASPSAYAALWSPDGRYLLYLVDLGMNGNSRFEQLTLFDLETRQERALGEPLELLSLIALIGWSPDSMRVAYTQWIDSSDGELVTAVDIVDILTGLITRFTSPPITLLEGSWSPTENQLLLLGDENAYSPGLPHIQLEMGGHTMIFLYDVANGSLDQLLGPSSYLVSKSPWSSDGKRVIYSDWGRICQLDISSREETCSSEIANAIALPGVEGGWYPSWSPTGEWIGFLLKMESLQCSPIAVIRPDGSDLRFTDAESGDCAVFGPIWSPRK